MLDFGLGVEDETDSHRISGVVIIFEFVITQAAVVVNISQFLIGFVPVSNRLLFHPFREMGDNPIVRLQCLLVIPTFEMQLSDFKLFGNLFVKCNGIVCQHLLKFHQPLRLSIGQLTALLTVLRGRAH